jgi:hypothetical protein
MSTLEAREVSVGMLTVGSTDSQLNPKAKIAARVGES